MRLTKNCYKGLANNQESYERWSELEPDMKKPKIEQCSPELIIDKEVRRCPQCKNEIEVNLYWL